MLLIAQLESLEGIFAFGSCYWLVKKSDNFRLGGVEIRERKRGKKREIECKKGRSKGKAESLILGDLRGGEKFFGKARIEEFGADWDLFSERRGISWGDLELDFRVVAGN